MTKKKIIMLSGRMLKPASVKMFGPYDDRVIVTIVYCNIVKMFYLTEIKCN